MCVFLCACAEGCERSPIHRPQNPSILDGPRGLELSSQQRAAAEARLLLPSSSEANGGALVSLDDAGASGQLVDMVKLRAMIPEGELYPARPAEAGPGDQLILQGVPETLQLNRGEILEMFVRHKEDPEVWTAARLAHHYHTDVRWVENLLRYCMGPTVVRVDGDLYGVYDVRDPLRGDTPERRLLQAREKRLRDSTPQLPSSERA
jgi:hypothetical protein